MSVSQIYNAGNNASSPSLTIRRPAVFHACFCKMVVEPIYEEEITEYIVQSGDGLGRIARRNNVERSAIKTQEEPPTTPSRLRRGDVLNIHSQRETGKNISFEYLEEAAIGMEVYIVVETQGLRSKKIQIKIRQGKEQVITSVDSDIEVTQDDSQLSTIECTVGAFAEDESIINRAEFEDWAIAKIKLSPSESNLKSWINAVTASTDNNASLYLKVDAHTGNGDLEQDVISYCGTNLSTSGERTEAPADQWLDIEGKWFQLIYPLAPWIEIAKRELGVQEDDRDGGGFERVQAFHEFGSGRPDRDSTSDAWCSSFINWVIRKTNEEKGTNFSDIENSNFPSRSQNWYRVASYPNGVRISPGTKAPYGSFMVKKNIGKAGGHVSFVVKYVEQANGDLHLDLLGGNQGGRAFGGGAVIVQTYIFEKRGSDYIYTTRRGSQSKLKGFVLPPEYHFDENNDWFFQYDEPEDDIRTAEDLGI